MAYIYKITNNINGKIYIGKTEFNIEKRFKEHIRDSKKDYKNRPLYKAMNKYGTENFSIELVEKTSIPEEREKYWIEYYGSFKYGYNATLGGDGKRYADYGLIFNLWQAGFNNKEIHDKTGYDQLTIKTALNSFDITEQQRQKRGREKQEKYVMMLDKNTEEILKIFTSIADAYRFLNKQHSGHIADVCNGKRKTAYGYKWQYSVALINAD